MATQFTIPRQVKINVAGRPYAGAQAFFYQTATETPQLVYQDSALTVPHAQPVVADDDGYFPVVWLDPDAGFNYRVRILSSTGSLLDDVPDVQARLISSAQVIEDVTQNLDSLKRAPAEIAAGVTPANYAYPPLNILRYGTNTSPGTTDMTSAFDQAVRVAYAAGAALIARGAVETTFVDACYVTITIPSGIYKIAATNGVELLTDTAHPNIEFASDSGCVLIGADTNKCFHLNGGAFKNRFHKILFNKFGTAITIDTDNKNESMLQIDSCRSLGNDIFIDTTSYAASRSTMIDIRNSFCGDTRVFVKHYTDHMSIRECWMYAQVDSADALLYLSGDGLVNIHDSFFIPSGAQIANPEDARFIDFVCDSAQSTSTDRSVKMLNIKGCRASLESARGFIWTYDNNATKPNGNNAVSSITVEDSYVACTGGFPVVRYMTGYPGSVSLRNCKVLASPFIVGIDDDNSTGPAPSTPTAITSHVIMIDEATRLSQSNSYTIGDHAMVDPDLEPFVYDTTSQTSKYKRSIRKNIDYRLRAASAGSNLVKVTIPIFFDSANATSNMDVLTFLLVTVSDALGPSSSSPFYRSTCVSLVTVIGGTDGTPFKRLVSTVLQDAAGGISFGSSAEPTIFWGTGNSGSLDVAPTSTSGTEDNITAVWEAEDLNTAWAYILPLAGLRENQWDKQQFDVW